MAYIPRWRERQGSDNAGGEETTQDIEFAMPSTPESTAAVAVNVDNSRNGVLKENAPDYVMQTL